MELFLALDPGGTKCEAVAVREDGELLGWGRHRELGVSGRNVATIRKAAESAVAGLAERPRHAIIIGSESAKEISRHWDTSVRQVREHLDTTLSWTPPHFIFTTEWEGAFAIAGETCGVVALAGTGAFLFGRTHAGTTCFLDALGPVLGDTGGAYGIGLQGLRAAVRHTWHPRRQTSLHGRVLELLRAANIWDVVAFSLDHHDRSVIASIARVVDEEAERGDAIARGILEAAADGLADTLRDVVDRLALQTTEYPLLATGSVITRSRLFWARFQEQAHAIAPGLRPQLNREPPVLGVVLAGITKYRRLPAAEQALLRERLLASYRHCQPKGTTA
jgi:N-acetylglucosamine kinase-like BadF-type ATPase